MDPGFFIDPYSKLVIETFVKTVTSRTIDLAVEGISKTFHALIRAGKREEALQFLADNSEIKQPLVELANRALEESVIVPYLPEAAATPDEKFGLFTEVVKAGMAMSRQLRADVFLPGSILGTHTWSVFSASMVLNHTLSGRTMKINPIWGAHLAIVPAAEPVEDCTALMEEVRRERELTDTYINLANVLDSPYKVTEINNLRVVYGSGKSIDDGNRAALGVETDEPGSAFSNETAPVRNWAAGIRMMLDFAPKVPSINFLPAEQGKEVRELLERVSGLYNLSTDTERKTAGL